MTYFPQRSSLRPASNPPGRVADARDVLWGRPLFKAPTLPNPRVMFDPLPFTAVRVTHPARRR